MQIDDSIKATIVKGKRIMDDISKKIDVGPVSRFSTK